MNNLISREAAIIALMDVEADQIQTKNGTEIIDVIQNVPIVPAIPIPENVTNGDVLKRLLYGKAIITEFIHDVNIRVNNNVIGQLDMEWWNSPYKRGETE